MAVPAIRTKINRFSLSAPPAPSASSWRPFDLMCRDLAGDGHALKG
jgi:hypothetical protein